jgi:CMP-N,N'-diacetyllegionaminic acid synthase
MINDLPCLGVIPARGGSKRLPRKNIMMLADKPLIQWTIEAGLESKVIDKLIVSTDDIEIASVSRRCGANVPFIRPSRLSKDITISYDVLDHALCELESQSEQYAYIIMLQPTSPLRSAQHIDAAASLLINKKADGVVSVVETEHPIQWCNVLPESLEMSSFIDPICRNVPSQDFPATYQLNGAIYISTVDRLRKEKSPLYGDGMFAYKMPRYESVDIDELIDFQFAEFLMLSN